MTRIYTRLRSIEQFFSNGWYIAFFMFGRCLRCITFKFSRRKKMITWTYVKSCQDEFHACDNVLCFNSGVFSHFSYSHANFHQMATRQATRWDIIEVCVLDSVIFITNVRRKWNFLQILFWRSILVTVNTKYGSNIAVLTAVKIVTVLNNWLLFFSWRSATARLIEHLLLLKGTAYITW